MVAFYEASVKDKLEQDVKEKKALTLQSIADNDVGSIMKDLVKADPEYGKNELPNVNMSEQATSLKDRWAKMNNKKSRENAGYGMYGTLKRPKNDDESSWI